MSPLARLASLEHDQEPDFAVVIEQIKRACGVGTYDLAVALRLKPRQLTAIEQGDREPTWTEGDLLLRALEACRRS